MEELKTCLFCGKNVDRSFQYCPHCGYEFGQGEELSALLEESLVDTAAEGEEDYLLRLRTLQELLADMERELDLIIRTSSRDP
jgi:predicted amidophosphoribosyltransferase